MSHLKSKTEQLLGWLITRAAVPFLEFYYLFSRRRYSAIGVSLPKMKSRNIVIVGGELFNRGAQAMTFALVDGLVSRYPDCVIYLLSSRETDGTGANLASYQFTILPWTWRIRLAVFAPLLSLLARDHRRALSTLSAVLGDTRFVVDISGYALSSQWGPVESFYYLINIMIAQKAGIPYYIFPQSIGPLDYGFLGRMLIPNTLLHHCLRYPGRIFVREAASLQTVAPFTGRKNVRVHPDLLFSARTGALSNIYHLVPPLKTISVPPCSVGIIPNLRVMERSMTEVMRQVYAAMVAHLLDAGKTVFLLQHSHEDLQICQQLKDGLPLDPRINLIADNLNAFELEAVIRQFDFVVASRYHAIVQGYRHGVPALVIGWAAKYRHLLANFNQLAYFFDIRNGLSPKEVERKLKYLLEAHERERKQILGHLGALMLQDVFAVLPQNSKGKSERDQ